MMAFALNDRQDEQRTNEKANQQTESREMNKMNITYFYIEMYDEKFSAKMCNEHEHV